MATVSIAARLAYKDPAHILEIADTRGVYAAAQYVLADKTQGLYAYFVAAWIEFSINEYEKAEAKAYSILNDPDATPKLKADSFYLLAAIEFATGHYEVALGFYAKALGIYEREQLPGDIFKASIEKARVHLRLGDPKLAEEVLADVKKYQQNPKFRDIGQ